MKTEEIKLSPRKAKHLDQICRLNEDNTQAKDYWMLVGEGQVTLAKQKNGEENEFMVSIKRADFDKLIDWYNCEQKLKQ